MFGLGSLLFVRDFIHGPQSQQAMSILAQGDDRQGESSIMGSQESYKLSCGRRLDDDIVVGVLFRNSQASINPDSRLTENRTSTPAPLIEISLGANDYPVQSHKALALNHDLPRALRTQSEGHFSPKHDSRFSSLPFVPPSKVEPPTKVKYPRDQGIKSAGSNSHSKAQLFPQRQASPLPPVVKNRGRTPSQVSQITSKVRRLSPLRESSGIVDRNAGSDQQTLIVQKTRKSLQPLLRTSEPFERLCKSTVPDCALKSLLSPKSSFSEDYTNNTAFLGRHRPFNSAKLSEPLYHSRLVSRTASVSGLRHLPPDKGRTLYIGVNAHKIFLPAKQHSSSNETVKYLQSPRKERQIPALTPYAIFPSRDLEYLEFMSPTKVACAGPTSAVDSTGNRRRSSSDVSNAGSEYSSNINIIEDVDMYQSSDTDLDNDNRRGQFFDAIALIMRRREEVRLERLPAEMKSMMSSFQASISNSTDETQSSPHAEQTGTYFTFSNTLSTLKIESVNSETSFHDEAAEALAEKRVNFMPGFYYIDSPTPSGNHSTTDAESLARENFWVKLRNLFAGCFSTR